MTCKPILLLYSISEKPFTCSPYTFRLMSHCVIYIGQSHPLLNMVSPVPDTLLAALLQGYSSRSQSGSCVLQVFHGTTPPAHASGIARKGPDFTRIGGTNGAAYGRGFYTTDDIAVAAQYAAGNGGICLCQVLQGNIKSSNFSANDTAGSLFKAGYHSVHDPQARFMVLFHPDAVCVTHIANLGPDSTMAEQLAAAKQKLDDEHAAKEMVRKAEVKVRHCHKSLPWLFIQRAMHVGHECSAMPNLHTTESCNPACFQVIYDGNFYFCICHLACFCSSQTNLPATSSTAACVSSLCI